MNKQDNRLALSVLANLAAGIALIYTFIVFHNIIFAVAGMSLVFLVTAFMLTQNIITYIRNKNTEMNSQIKDSVDDLSTRIESISNAQSQLAKANYLYTRQIAQTITTLENNYTESQEALYKNLAALSSSQNKATKLLIKYDQSNTTKVISTLKDLRNQLSDTMIQGFDQIQPNNTEMITALEDIVTYLKSQPAGMDQTMGLQLNNVAHELQNISNSIQQVQKMPQQPIMPQMAFTNPMTYTEPVAAPVAAPVASATDTSLAQDLSPENILQEAIAETLPEVPVADTIAENITESEMDELLEALDDIAIPEENTESTPEEATDTTLETPIAEEASETLDDLDALLNTADVAEPITEEPVAVTPVSDDPNKQLSADEIAALFAAAEPAPKKEEPAPEPVAVTPVSDDPNKQLSADEIAALFAAAEPAPKKEDPAPEPVAVTPVSDDPNKQLSPDEIAALFASMG